MKPLQFEQAIENFPGFRADAVAGDLVVEALIEPRDARRLRTALLEIARVASTDSTRRVIHLLEQPNITASRLH